MTEELKAIQTLEAKVLSVCSIGFAKSSPAAEGCSTHLT
jgi:hypothetical protein